MSRSIEESGRWILDAALHLLQEWLEHLTCWGLEQGLGLVVVLLPDSLARQELSSFVGEHVAVVADDFVFVLGILEPDILEVILVDFLGDLGLTEGDLLDGFAEGGSFRWICDDSGSIVILLAEDDEGGVVDGIDLLSDHHHAEILGHTHGDVVDVEGDGLGHGVPLKTF